MGLSTAEKLSILNSIDDEYDRTRAMKTIMHVRKVRLVFPKESLFSYRYQKMAASVFLTEHRNLKFKTKDKGDTDV